MRILIVVLPLEQPGATTPLEYVLTLDGRTVATHDRAVAALLPAASEIVALVPAQAVSWHRVELPRGTLARGALGGSASAPRLRAVLEGMLEDRLLDDPAELHFALQPDARAQAPAWVAACNRPWLKGALALLETARRPVARVVPEITPVAAQLQVIGSPEQAQLAYSADDGVCILPFSSAAMDWALARAASPDTALEIVAEPALAALAEQAAGRPVTLQQNTERWLAAARSPWDLAQFDLANSDRSRAWKRTADQALALWRAPQWRAARWGAVVLVAAHLAGLNAWAFKESGVLAAKRATVNATLTNSFPGVKVVVDAPVQMERELALLRQSAGAYSQRDLEAMLDALGNALAPAQSLQAIEFALGEAKLKGLDLGADAAVALNSKLQTSGMRAEQQADRWVVRPDSTRGGAP